MMFKLEKKCGGYVYRDRIFFTRPTKKQIEKIDKEVEDDIKARNSEKKRKRDIFKDLPDEFKFTQNIKESVEMLTNFPWLIPRWKKRAKKGNVIATQTLKIIGE